MFHVKEYDLGQEIERVGFYQDVVDEMIASKNSGIIGRSENNIDWSNRSEEVKKELNKERSIKRSKTKIRRLAQRYNMKYMWTLTFAKKEVITFNPVNKKTITYDAGNYDDCWRLWKSFLKRCKDVGLEFNYIVTIEVQEKRLAEYGEKVYHFHFITDKSIPTTSTVAKRQGKKYNIFDLWGHGRVHVSKKKSKKRLVHLYIVKYISKLIEEMGTGRQRYRVKEGMTIPFKEFYLQSHIDFFMTVQNNNIRKNNYNLIGDLELFWMIYEKDYILT